MHPNEERARKAYEAFAKGDMATLTEQFADDVLWHNAGRGPLSGDYRGKQSVFEFFGKLTQITGGSFRTDIQDVLANDERVVVIANSRMTLGGETIEARNVAVYEVDAEGRTKEATFFFDDPYQAIRAEELERKAAESLGLSISSTPPAVPADRSR